MNKNDLERCKTFLENLGNGRSIIEIETAEEIEEALAWHLANS